MEMDSPALGPVNRLIFAFQKQPTSDQSFVCGIESHSWYKFRLNIYRFDPMQTVILLLKYAFNTLLNN